MTVQFGRPSSVQEPEENPTGSARSQPFVTRKQPEMFSFLLSRHRRRPIATPNVKYDYDKEKR